MARDDVPHPGLVGLPDGVRGCLFDMDGVLTKTATVHAAAWKAMFDEFLAAQAAAAGKPFVAFDSHDDYDRYVDGKARADGVRAFLRSRGIALPEGGPDDTAGARTIYGLGNRKNALVLERLARDGVEVYDDAVAYAKAVRDAGLRRAVVSASANTAQVLEAARIADLFEARIDGVVASQRHLAGKPSPDMFAAGAEALGLTPIEAAIFEDSLAGVEAGRAGGFVCVVGVDRVGQATELREHGATVVVSDLTELVTK